MVTRDVGTTHDLADYLEEAAKALRALPAIPLAQEKALDKATAEASSLCKSDTREYADASYTAFAEALPGLAREDAQNELQSLTVDGIRRTAASLGIRVPSKSRKSDAIDLVLAQMFDVPAGQELLRTFHKRNLDNRNTPSRIRQPNQRSRRSEMKK